MNRPCAVALIALGLLAAVPGAATAATRYAAPVAAGAADCSSSANACSLLTALNGADSLDTIVIGVGTHPFGDYLDDGKDLTIRGAVIGSRRPVVQGPMSLSGPGTRLTDVEIDVDGSAVGLELVGAEADRVIATSAERDGCSLEAGAVIQNAVCVSLLENFNSGLAVQGEGAVTARNVDAVGTYGLYGNNGPSDVGLTATDAIAFSRDEDDGEDVTSNAGTMTLLRVAYDTADANTPINSTDPESEAPLFRSLTDFRQGPTSPTIDRGGDGAGSTELDLNGNLRKIGAAVDLGAYEHVPAAPTATTSAPSPVGTTTATLQGAIDTKGGLTTYHVEYGPTAALGSSTPTITLPAGTGPSPVQVDLTGLARNATVHYKIVAESDGGSGGSGVATFDTLPFPPTATSEAAADVAATTATARGSVGTDGDAGTAHFEVTAPGGTTFSTADQPVSDGQSVSAALAGLAPASGYAYTLVVTTAAGTARSGEAGFTTAAAPLGPSPSGLRPNVTLVTTSATPDRRRRVTLSLRCTGPASGCSGTVRLRTAAKVKVPGSRKRRRVTFGRAGFASLKPGQVTKVRARLSRRNLRVLRSLKGVRVVATITVEGGVRPISTARLRLNAPRRP